MKISSMILGIVFILFTFIIVPFGLIQLNNYWSLPTYNFLLFKIIGILLVFIGIHVCLYCIGAFHFIGQGTPIPFDPPKKLVVRGLYKYSRNPMMAGYLLVVFGEFFYFGPLLLLLYAATAFLIINLLLVYWEEPILKKRFGKNYENYFKKTPRWL